MTIKFNLIGEGLKCPPKRAQKRRQTKAVKLLEKIDKLVPVSSLQPPKPKLKMTPRCSDVTLRLESALSTSVPTSPNLKDKNDFSEFQAYVEKRN